MKGEKRMTKANEKQVGGKHYFSPTGHQHWDMVVDHQLNYFEGQVTKYVMRARKKNGKQDLEKALHFLEKYLEVYDRVVGAVTEVQPVGETVAKLQAEAALAKGNFTAEGYFGDGTAHFKCVHCKTLVRCRDIVEAFHQHSACALAHSQLQHP
jgi:hypothetical protein